MPRSPLKGDVHTFRDSRGKAEPVHRPVLVVSRQQLNAGDFVIVAEFTSEQLEKRKSQDFCVYVPKGEGNLPRDCVVNLSNLTKMRRAEFTSYVGTLPADILAEVDNALKWVLEIP